MMTVLTFEGGNLLMLRAALVCVATADSRYYLNGVHLTERYVEGADGTRAARFAMPDQPAPTDGLDVIVPRFKIAARTQRVLITVNGEQIEVQEVDVNGVEIRTKLTAIDGRYPDLGRIIPEEAARVKIDSFQFNPMLLADVLKAIRWSGGVKLTSHGEYSAFTVLLPSLPDLTFVCMPMRDPATGSEGGRP